MPSVAPRPNARATAGLSPAPPRDGLQQPPSLMDAQERGPQLDLVLRDEHEPRRVAERHEGVLARDSRDTTVVAGVDELGDHALRDAARPPRLVDNEHAPGCAGLAQDVLDRKGREPAQIEHACVDTLLGELARDAERQVQPVRPGHDREIRTIEIGPRRADGHMLVDERGDPAFVVVLVEIARVVQRDRLEEDADRSVDERGLRAGDEHRRRVVGRAQATRSRARDVAENADRIVVMEVPAEPALVAVAGDPDHHPVAICALREELQRRRLAA